MVGDGSDEWVTFERSEATVERRGRFAWLVVRRLSDYWVEQVGKPHRFAWTARRHASRLPVGYYPVRTGLSRGEALDAIGWPR